MDTKCNIKKLAVDSIKEQSKAIDNLASFINNDFVHIVELIAKCKGRLIITGVGKSANIGSKIVATLNSTGTPASFMHAADAVHGDLGIVQKEDVVLCISNSGSTTEVKALIPIIKSLGNILIAFCGNKKSYLSTNANFVINTEVGKEICPNNLAPTTSTAAQLVMGDALAVCLLNVKGFTSNDFAKNHPGGALGKKLYLTVEDLCFEVKPQVLPNDSINNVIVEITSNRLGATTVIEDEKIIGIITDGDLRRMMQSNENFQNIVAKDIMTSSPKIINHNQLAAEALNLMKSNNITQLVVTKASRYLGIIHIHDILKEGI